MQAKEFFASRNNGLHGDGANGNAANPPAEMVVGSPGASTLVSPAGSAARGPGIPKPYLWLAGAAAVGALATWLMMRRKGRD